MFCKHGILDVGNLDGVYATALAASLHVNTGRPRLHHLTTGLSRRYRHIATAWPMLFLERAKTAERRYAGPEADLRGTSN
jgi:hypothetical protein